MNNKYLLLKIIIHIALSPTKLKLIFESRLSICSKEIPFKKQKVVTSNLSLYSILLKNASIIKDGTLEKSHKSKPKLTAIDVLLKVFHLN